MLVVVGDFFALKPTVTIFLSAVHHADPSHLTTTIFPMSQALSALFLHFSHWITALDQANGTSCYAFAVFFAILSQKLDAGSTWCGSKAGGSPRFHQQTSTYKALNSHCQDCVEKTLMWIDRGQNENFACWTSYVL